MNQRRWGARVAEGSVLFGMFLTVVAIAAHLPAFVAAILGGSVVFVVVFVGSIINGLKARSGPSGETSEDP